MEAAIPSHRFHAHAAIATRALTATCMLGIAEIPPYSFSDRVVNDSHNTSCPTLARVPSRVWRSAWNRSASPVNSAK